jgi:hypothetical protein
VLKCKCGAKVKVGFGGQHNLEYHQKSQAHKDAMEAKKYPAITHFFTMKPKQAKSSALVPPRLHNMTSSSSTTSPMIDPSPSTSVQRNSHRHSQLLVDLREASCLLPDSVPEGRAGDELAVFSTKLQLDPLLDDHWEALDPVLNGFLGWGKSKENIKLLIRRGAFGMDGFCNWIETAVNEGGISEVLLKDKLARLLEAMQELYVWYLCMVEYENNQLFTVNRSSAPFSLPGQAVETNRAPASTVGIVIQDCQKSMTETADIDDDISIINVRTPEQIKSVLQMPLEYALPGKDSKRPRCPGFELKMPPGQSPYTSYPFAMHADMHCPWTPHFDGQRLFLRSDNCQGHTHDIPCNVCSCLGRHSIISGIIERMQEGAKEHTNWKWLSFSQLLQVTYCLSRQYKDSRLSALNTGCMLAQRACAIEEHKCFVLLVGSGTFIDLLWMARTDII